MIPAPMEEGHVTRSCSFNSSLSSRLLFLLLVVFIQSYDVTQAVAYDVREFNNPFLRDQVFSPMAPPETRSSQQLFPSSFQAVRSIPRYYVAGPAPEERSLPGDQGEYVEIERGVSEYPIEPRVSMKERKKTAIQQNYHYIFQNFCDVEKYRTTVQHARYDSCKRCFMQM